MSLSAAVLKPRIKLLDPYAANVVSLIRANDSPDTLIPVNSISNGIGWAIALSSAWMGTVSTPVVVSSGSYKASTHPSTSQPDPRLTSSFSTLLPSNQPTTFECSYLISSIAKTSVLAGYDTTLSTDWVLSYNRGILISPGVFDYPQRLDFGLRDTSTTTTTWYSLDFFPTVDTAFHIAVSSTYNSLVGTQTHYVFVNGILKLTVINPKQRFASGRIGIGGGSIVATGSSSLRLGQLFYWDEARFTTGVARYTSNYTPVLPHLNP